MGDIREGVTNKIACQKISVVDPDPHQSDKLVRINLQMTSQNVWNMCLFEHFFKVFIYYLDARIRIRNKVKGRIRIHIKVKGRIRIRICLLATLQKMYKKYETTPVTMA
jgi:hypothetical protein